MIRSATATDLSDPSGYVKSAQLTLIATGFIDLLTQTQKASLTVDQHKTSCRELRVVKFEKFSKNQGAHLSNN